LEKINSNNASFENERNKKYRNLKEKYNSIAEKKNDFEAELHNFENQINEKSSLISSLQAEKQDICKRFITKNKEYEKLYREFCKNKEETEFNQLKSKAEIERLHLDRKELEKRFFKEKEINKNLENYNSQLLEENEILMQEKISAKSL